MVAANKKGEDNQANTATESTLPETLQELSGSKKKQLETLKEKIILQEEFIVEKIMSNKIRNLMLLVLGLAVLWATVFATRNAYDPNDLSTWSGNDMKEWLAEHRIRYSGIPSKEELLELVKSHRGQLQEESKSTVDSVENFVQQYIDMTKNLYGEAEDEASEKLTQLNEEVADIFETLRQTTGLTEDQVLSTFDQIKKKLAATKSKANENLASALEKVGQSYRGAQAQRDEIANEAAKRIKKDYKKSKKVSQDTIDWFKDQINKMSQTAGFAKTRTQTQTTLILGSIQEQLASSKDATVDQIEETYNSLNESAKEYYKDIEGNLERLRNELAGKIGGTANFIVEELRTQVTTLGDYSTLTQEKIQGILDNIGNRVSEGKDITRDQLVEIVKIVHRYLVHPVKSYYHSTTQQVKETSSQVRDASQESLNNIIETVRNAFTKARQRPDEKMPRIFETVEQEIQATQQLTSEQTKIIKQTIQEQFGNIKDVRDLTEDKVSSFAEALKQRLSQAMEKAQKGYENTKDTVQEGYEATKEKAKQGIEMLKEEL